MSCSASLCPWGNGWRKVMRAPAPPWGSTVPAGRPPSLATMATLSLACMRMVRAGIGAGLSRGLGWSLTGVTFAFGYGGRGAGGAVSHDAARRPRPMNPDHRPLRAGWLGRGRWPSPADGSAQMGRRWVAETSRPILGKVQNMDAPVRFHFQRAAWQATRAAPL